MDKVKRFEAHFGVRLHSGTFNTVDSEKAKVELFMHQYGVLAINKQIGECVLTPYSHIVRIEPLIEPPPAPKMKVA